MASRETILEVAQRTYGALLGGLLPPGVEPTSDKAREAARLFNLALLALLAVPCFVVEFAVFELWILAAGLATAGVFMVSIPWIYKKTGSIPLARETFLVALGSFKIGESIYFQSIVSPGSMWFVALPGAAILMGSIRSGICWLFISIAATIGLYFHYDGTVAYRVMENNAAIHVYTFSLVFMIIALMSFLLMVDYGRKQAVRRLEEAHRTMRDLATRDPLTGAFNRRYVCELLQREEDRASTDLRAFSVLLIDIDKFKSINDNFGHQAGDDVIKSVSAAISREMSEDECFGRYGGEEFICVVPAKDATGAMALAEQIRHRVSRIEFDGPLKLRSVTISIGVSEFRLGETFSATIARADAALYAAKEAGRNCVRSASPGEAIAVPELERYPLSAA